MNTSDSRNQISIVVPTLNEVGNVTLLVERVAACMEWHGFEYEIIVVDDHSTDGTQQLVRKLRANYPVRLSMKRGKRGKAYSLLQGFSMARYDVLCMIDADLQYPPEAIGPMLLMLQKHGSDIVLSERRYQGVSRLRRVVTKGFNLVFTRALFGISYDAQSGLKVFRKSVLDGVKLSPTPWGFDLEFIIRGLERGKKVLTYRIPFVTRNAGEAKVRVVKVSFELAKAALSLRLRSSKKLVRRGYRMSIATANKLTALVMVSAVLVAVSAAGKNSDITYASDRTVEQSALPVIVSTIDNLDLSQRVAVTTIAPGDVDAASVPIDSPNVVAEPKSDALYQYPGPYSPAVEPQRMVALAVLAVLAVAGSAFLLAREQRHIDIESSKNKEHLR